MWGKKSSPWGGFNVMKAVQLMDRGERSIVLAVMKKMSMGLGSKGAKSKNGCCAWGGCVV